MGLQAGSATGGFSPDDTHGAAWSGGRNYFQCGAALRSGQLGASYYAGTVRDAGVKIGVRMLQFLSVQVGEKKGQTYLTPHLTM